MGVSVVLKYLKELGEGRWNIASPRLMDYLALASIMPLHPMRIILVQTTIWHDALAPVTFKLV